MCLLLTGLPSDILPPLADAGLRPGAGGALAERGFPYIFPDREPQASRGKCNTSEKPEVF